MVFSRLGRWIWVVLIFGLVIVVGLLVVNLKVEKENQKFKEILLTVEKYPELEGYQDDNEGSWGSYNLYFLGFSERYYLNGRRLFKHNALALGYFTKYGQPVVVYARGLGRYREKDLSLWLFKYSDEVGSFETVKVRDEKELQDSLKNDVGRLIGAGFYYEIKNPDDSSSWEARDWFIRDGGSGNAWKDRLEIVRDKDQGLSSWVLLPLGRLAPGGYYGE